MHNALTAVGAILRFSFLTTCFILVLGGIIWGSYTIGRRSMHEEILDTPCECMINDYPGGTAE